MTDTTNEYLALTAAEARAAAQELGLELDLQLTPEELSPQLQCVSRWLESAVRPAAILVMSVREQGFGRLARQALASGIHWLFLNRTAEDIEDLRRVNPAAAVGEVSCDHLEAGRIQGRIARRLRPGGGRLSTCSGAGAAAPPSSVPPVSMRSSRVEASP